MEEDPKYEVERSRIFHDYIFQNYSDDAGEIKVNELPTTVSIEHRDEKHEISVRAAVGLQSWCEFTLILSYRRVGGPLEESGSENEVMGDFVTG